LAPVPAAELVDELEELAVLVEVAELLLLPHAAMPSVTDTASATVAHALCRLTLTSTGPGRCALLASHSSWVVPQVMPG
jgi:hypothetical protein